MAKFLVCNQNLNGATSVIQHIRTKREAPALSPCQRHTRGPMQRSGREMLDAESQACSHTGDVWSAGCSSAPPGAPTQSHAFSGQHRCCPLLLFATTPCKPVVLVQADVVMVHTHTADQGQRVCGPGRASQHLPLGCPDSAVQPPSSLYRAGETGPGRQAAVLRPPTWHWRDWVRGKDTAALGGTENGPGSAPLTRPSSSVVTRQQMSLFA